MTKTTTMTARSASRVVVLAFALIALAPASASAQVRTPTHVACVGDSITYGYAASSASKSYPSDLQTLFGSGVMVRNFGRNSATLLSTGDLPYINQTEYTAATTFVSGAGASAVVDVIIMLGTNDTKSYNWNPTGSMTRAQQFMTDLGAMVDHFTGLASHPVVYLALPPAIYSNSFGISESVASNEIDPIIRQVATQKGMPIIDVHTPTAGHMDYFSDGVHPTDAGYMIVAQIMHDGLLAASTGAGGAGGRGGSGGGGGSGGRGGAGGAAGGAGGGMAGRGGAAGGAAGRGGSSGGGTGGGAAGRGGAGGGGTGGGMAGAGGAGTGGTAAGTGGAATGTGGGGGGSIGGAAAGGTGGGGASTGGAAGAGAGGAGTGGTGTAGAGPSGAGGAAMATGGDGGCSCGVGGGARSGFAALGFVLAMLVLRRRARLRADARSARPGAG